MDKQRRKPMSQETKDKISKALTGTNNGMFGKIGEQNPNYEGKHNLRGEEHPNYGKTWSDEQRKKHDEYYDTHDHPSKGKARSAEVRKKISEVKKKYWADKKSQPDYVAQKLQHRDIDINVEIINKLVVHTKELYAFPEHPENGYIYVLKDPITTAIRYVGQTLSPKIRIAGVINAEWRNTYSHKTCWVVGLLKENHIPLMEIIETIPKSVLDEREQYWIAHYKSQGLDLANETIGGQGNNERSTVIHDKNSKTCSRRRLDHLMPILETLGAEIVSTQSLADISGITLYTIQQWVREGHLLRPSHGNWVVSALLGFLNETNKDLEEQGYRRSVDTRPWSEKVKMDNSRKVKGESHPNFGKKHDETLKQKISNSLTAGGKEGDINNVR